MKLLRCLFIAALLMPGIMSCARGGTMAAISVSPETNVVAEGKTHQLQATAVFSDGTVLTWTSAVTWEIAPQDGTTGTAIIGNKFGSYGLVTSTSGTGDFTVRASDVANGLISPVVVVHVRRPDIAITPANPFIPLGVSHQFKATGTMVISEGTGTTTVDLTSSVTWTTDPVIDGSASVKTSGLVTASSMTTGTTNLIATYIVSGATLTTASTTLTVTATPVQAITIESPAGLNVAPGGTLTLSATGHYSDPSITPDFTRCVEWISSDTRVATINSDGILSAVKAGATTVTAKDPISGISTTNSLSIVVQ